MPARSGRSAKSKRSSPPARATLGSKSANRRSGRPTGPNPRNRRRRRWPALAAGILVILTFGSFGLVALAGAGSSGSKSPGVSTTIAPARLSDITTRPSFVQIVYQVSGSDAGSTKTTWEVLTENRPDTESDLTYDANPLLGAAPASGTVTTPSGIYTLSSGRLQAESGSEPGVGSADQAIGVELADLQSRSLAEPTGQTLTIAGRSCAVVEMSGPPNGPIATFSGSNNDDLCIDSDGLIRSEIWTYEGQVALQRTAVEVRLTNADPQIKGAPSTTTALPAKGSPSIDISSATNPSAAFIHTPPDPSGFGTDRTVAVTVHNPSKASSVLDSSTVWSFEQGGNLITVEAGTGQLPWQANDTPSEAVTLTGLGAATSALQSSGPEIRVQLSANRWVRVDGTVGLSELTAYADQLTPANGTKT